MKSCEVNFDGIVGPTHHYAGLSRGNIASMKNQHTTSNPRKAALEGLDKMRFLAGLGVKQAVLPPHERPHLPTLRALGFSGSDSDVLACAAKTDRSLLASVSSASAMWCANAATVSPSRDSADGKVHFTPANLLTTFHRSLETATTATVLLKIFADDSRFAHHAPLPSSSQFADEGAANHTRLWFDETKAGIQLFTFGRGGENTSTAPRFPARQAGAASQAVARLHQLSPGATFFMKQSSRAIDAGAFHNDVVAVGHRNVLLFHEAAWEDVKIIEKISRAFEAACGGVLHLIRVSESELSLDEAVSTYLFNSQLVTLLNGSIALIAPVECRDHPRAAAVIDRIIAESNPISAVHYVDVRQSMRNGGGPACLRLRVHLQPDELAATHRGSLFTDALHSSLRDWITRHYRETLQESDLSDPHLLHETRAALDELSRLLNLGSLYSFQ